MTKSLRPAALAAAAVLSAACAASRPAPAAPVAAPARPAAPTAAPVQTEAAPAPAPAPVVAPKSDRHKFWGDVQSYDAASGTIVVKNKSGKSRKFRIAAAAKFTKGGGETSIAAADVASGSSVRVVYAGDVLVSLHVFVKSAP